MIDTRIQSMQANLGLFSDCVGRSASNIASELTAVVASATVVRARPAMIVQS